MKKASFTDNVVRMQSNLMNFAFKLTMDKDRASDLVQETTLKALDSQGKFAENVNFKGWLFTIMRNIFINNYRRNVRQSSLVDTTDNLFKVGDSQMAPETPDGTYAVNEISEVIAKIPTEFSRPFQLHVAGYKYDEIAEILKLPLGTVKSRIFTTRTQLKIMLKDYR
ncbi:MAG: sigma-70 family RNA polymerase sigma factor [Prevotella sp.]|nr:sigma-70 family RNA polymerase sigma factor [Prevotella sp.]MCM1075713.1 sigma-70 family RNA polymerase sigma factor [Ruminococcus sp.]